jgi:hypothetical protein
MAQTTRPELILRGIEREIATASASGIATATRIETEIVTAIEIEI